MDSSVNYPIIQFIKDLAVLVLPYRVKFIIGFILRLTSDVARLYPAFALSQIIPLLGNINNASSMRSIILLLIFWFLSAIYVGFGHDYSKYLGYQVGEAAGLDLYKKCLAHIFKIDLAL